MKIFWRLRLALGLKREVKELKEILEMESKPWYLSRGVWGSVLTIYGGISTFTGLPEIADPEALITMILQVVEAVTLVLGPILGLVGRIKAKKAITLT